MRQRTIKRPTSKPHGGKRGAGLNQEEALKAGALRDAIFNSAYFSAIATDEKGVIQLFNVGAERMLGYSAGDVVNRITPADISDPDEIIGRAALLSQELETAIAPGFEALVFKASRGIEDIYELTYIRKDGSRFPAMVSVTMLTDSTGSAIGYLLIGTDNTARKQVETAQALTDQKLRDQQFYTRSLIESNIDALVMTDPDGIISDVNQQMIELTGCTRSELIGVPSKEFFTDPVCAQLAMGKALSDGSVSDVELTVKSKAGGETVVSYNAATIYDREQKLIGVFAAARDATERKRIEQDLEAKNVELEHANRMKSEFLATMSHELRTPLNAIMGFSEALQHGLLGDVSDEQKEYIEDIFTSGQHLLSLINDILDLSKVEAGMMDLDLEVADLGKLLSNSLSVVREKAIEQRIELKLDIGVDLETPQLDLRKTKQIVYNLLSNAVKFSAKNSIVSLSARRVPRSFVGKIDGDGPMFGFPLADSGYSDFLQITVRDDGVGIAHQNLSKLFRAFSQVESGLARRYEGTGLGLAMVRQLTQLHEGTVAVASLEGAGTSFVVWLPLRTEALPEPVQPISRPARISASVAQTSVAIVLEDEDLSADLIRLLLEAEGFRVVRATSAEQALQLMAKHSPSLITIDVRLPGIDGWAFLRKVRARQDFAGVAIIVIAAKASKKSLPMGDPAQVLEKPVSRAQLKDSLEKLGLVSREERTRTILVVDDDPKAVEVMAAFLPSPSFSIIRAYGGREAIALTQRLQPDLILLDLMMPEISGFDVVTALREAAETQEIPILMISAKDVTSHDRATLRRMPGRSVKIVPKAGFDPAHFRTRVERALIN